MQQGHRVTASDYGGWAMRRCLSRIILPCLVSLMLVVPLGGCGKKDVKAERERVVNVHVWTVEKRSFRPFVETVGSLSPDEQVFVSSEVDGVLRSVRVDEGSVVGRGSVLAEINPTDYRLEVLRGKAALRQAEANLANTRLEKDRKAALFKEELVTRQQFDDVTTRLVLAEAELERAKATLSLAEERLAKTTIRAPLAGSIKEKRVSAGDFVRGGTPLFTIIRSDPLKLAFSVPQKDVGKLRLGQEISFKIDAYPDRSFQGRVNLISPSLEEKTRTVKVEAAVPNPGNFLKPGLFTRVVLYTAAPRDVVVAPATSILYDNQRTRVYIKDGDRAREREVKLGAKFDELVEVTTGLQAGEQIVAVGQNNLAEGMKINVAR